MRRAMEVMSSEQIGIVLVTDDSQRLLGIVVDSDLRKAILRGSDLSSPLSALMNATPLTAPADSTRPFLVQLFEKTNKQWIPLVHPDGRLASLALMGEYLKAEEQPNWVVLMAGGMGKRLHPLTESRPKPMMMVGDKPVLETIIERFTTLGFRHFYISVNYLAEQVMAHFEDGSRWGVEVRYLRETEPLGTAGALSLIEERPTTPVLVMNGDLLTKVNFRALLDYHRLEGNQATLCIRRFDVQIPYGVVETDGHVFQGIREKPTFSMYASAGISVLNPSTLECIPKASNIDMPTLLKRVNDTKPGSVGCFPIEEYWIDIGQHPDYQRAQTEYVREFA
jgi:dTDP-glucose pyrophosphorylase